MSGIWIPTSARTFDPQVEQFIADSPDPVEARRIAAELEDQGVRLGTEGETKLDQPLTPDAAMILIPLGWGTIHEEDRSVIVADVGQVPELRRMLEDATLEVELWSICDAAEEPLLQALCPALVMRLRQFQTFTPLEYPQCPCPGDWRHEVQANGLGLAVSRDRVDDDRILYVLSPRMHASQLALPERPHEVGRNDRCPCGSGIKFKRCCGR